MLPFSTAIAKASLAGLVAMVLTLGCERPPWEDPPAPPLVAITISSALRPHPLRDRSVQDSLESPPAPKSMPDFEHRTCADAAIAAKTPDARARVLSVRFEDPRTQRRHLVPRRIVELLESPVVGRYVEAADTLESAEPAAGSSRYLGVLFVTEYVPPRLIIRMGKLKHEWLEGVMTARLAIFDAESGEALCAIPVTASSDSTGAPVRVRLQGNTRVKLEKQLGQKVQDAARQALGEISKSLRWPELPRIDSGELWNPKPSHP